MCEYEEEDDDEVEEDNEEKKEENHAIIFSNEISKNTNLDSHYSYRVLIIENNIIFKQIKINIVAITSFQDNLYYRE